MLAKNLGLPETCRRFPPLPFRRGEGWARALVVPVRCARDEPRPGQRQAARRYQSACRRFSGRTGGRGQRLRESETLPRRQGGQKGDRAPQEAGQSRRRLSRLAPRLRAKRSLGRRPEQHSRALLRPCAVDPDEILLPGQRTRLAQARTAPDVLRRGDPSPLVFLCHALAFAPRPHGSRESGSVAQLRRCARVPGSDVWPPNLLVASHVVNPATEPPAPGDVRCHHLRNLHIFIAFDCVVLPARSLARAAAAARRPILCHWPRIT